MKKLFYIFISLVLLTGCEKFLEEDLKGTVPDNTYVNSHGFEVGAVGLYAYARAEWNTWSADPGVAHNACPYESFQIGTDIVFSGHNEGTIRPFENYTIHPQSTYVTTFWKWAYGLIGSANLLLEYSEKDVNWYNENDKEFYQAESRFFRAYAYRYLVYLYGDVPWVTKVEREFKDDFTRTPVNEVLDEMIEDLKFAAAWLPESPDKVKEGRLSTWAAKQLLVETYLLAGKYKEAELLADTIINSGYFQLMDKRFGKHQDEEGDFFSDMFKEYNQNRSSGNQENIWVMQLEYNTNGGGDANTDWTKRAWVPKYYNIDGFTYADSLGGRGLAQLVAFRELWNLYEEEDIRYSKYNVKKLEDWYFNDPKSPKYGKRVIDDTASTQKQIDAWYEDGKLCTVTTKFFYGKTASNPSYEGNSKDRIKFRLAETYLLRAEALIQLGRTAEAAEMINTIRRRAGATEVTANEIDIDFLLDERVRELLGEELRRFTLVRTGKLIERVKKHNPKSADKIKDHHVLWPIPQEVIDANSGVKFPQNDGY